ncbi:Multidrug resistance-associated protein 1 [Fragariocoptes setiger]|uniref:Multidrug resistance-associated protein 1 n=1 Tax=Fragariocoptes setiger TaxID=1670756 RepID=A0ABQ7SBK0_9ACAR|nr:Multidrug resistance-associated protein 1 [Fragariocoptes setiger]
MANFCNPPLWDNNLSWNTTNEPDLTPCFHETIMAWTPCVVLWLFAPLEFYNVLRAERRYIPITILNLFKSFLAVVLCFLSTGELIDSLLDGDGTAQVDYFTPMIRSFTYLVLSCIADRRAEFLNAGEDFRNRSPEQDASILSVLTFWWLNSIMLLGYKRPLTQDDIYSVRHEDKTEIDTPRFDALIEPQIKKALSNPHKQPEFEPLFDVNAGKLLNNSNKEKDETSDGVKNRRPNREDGELKSEPEKPKYVHVLYTLFQAYWPDLFLAGFLRLLASLLTFASPTLLGLLITFVSGTDPTWRGVFFVVLLFVSTLTESTLNNRQEYLTSLNVMRMRTCLTSVIYRKTLRLSAQGRKNYTTGEIVNLMAVDTQRVTDFVQNFNIIWSAPLQITICLILLWQLLGIGVLAGIGVILVFIPFNTWITSKLKDLQMLVMKSKDKRIKLLSEVFNGIKILKLHAWEEDFGRRVEAIRGDEIRYLTKQTWYSAGMTFAFTCMPFFVGLASFACFVLLSPNNILDANKAFVSLSLFNILRVPLALLPMILTNLANVRVSCNRINRYLESHEIDEKAIDRTPPGNNLDIKIEQGTFAWAPGQSPILTDINVGFEKRKLTAVVGTVGSGKSSLLSAMLGEMYREKGTIQIDPGSSISYVTQEAWILNATLRNNILFTKMHNKEQYRRVIDACALRQDLSTMDRGDETEIGEKGINLSGGQKQRVSLARAVYSDTDIYLLDDPLSAVDSHVGAHIFDKVIGPKGMLRDRTRILVTNKLSILPKVDRIIVIKDGRVSESGTYEELLSARGVFAQLLVKYLIENDIRTDITENVSADVITRELQRREQQEAERSREISPESNRTSPVRETNQSEEARSANNKATNTRNNTTETETAQIGSVSLDVHLRFLRTMGVSFLISLSVYVLSACFSLGTSLWLSEWSNDALNVTHSNNTQLRDIRLGVYAGLGLGETVCILISTVMLSLACLNSSRLLHNSMLRRILRAPLSWFNVTPSGRIMNRFSKDVDTMDSTIRFNVRLLILIALRSITSLILISVGSAYILIPVIPIVILYFLFQIFYVATSRQLKRIESMTKSPIYSHFGETVAGTSSIRAYGVTQQFILESNHRINVNNSSYYISFTAARWLAVRLEILGYIIVFITAMAAVTLRGSVTPGIAGLSITSALSVTTVLSMLVRTYSDFETNLVCIERMIEYTTTPTEPDDDTPPPNPDWPKKGEILFQDYCTRYRPELDLVLRNFNLQVAGSEKVGLVGRTGAGKSSVTLALFRILEPVNGSILIDDVDVTNIGLKWLRSRLSIIPQDPIMFSGTVRQNVDPSEKYDDASIWKAIKMAHLGDFVKDLEKQLDHEVSESGSNFSVGQRQLFCLARTLLRRSKILVLDEATASVDVETDDLIQKTIREEFKNSTVLTIAHRLETIQDYDKVVVMEDGRAVEDGPPRVLIDRPSSKFRDLAIEAGIANSNKYV